MSVAVITGSAGLIGSEACRKWHAEGFRIAGVDNDMRAEFFGAEASTRSTRARLEATLPQYRHYAVDIRSADGIERLFEEYGSDIKVIIHTAA
ncbi:MAG TPA: NAD-dependent epimerase/dehydratase family protein, partial [Chthoniobacteraceae bacterium]|nr:NAD-dependent epimerase/dehydratase family protein [Chthoniobacteraceae bacterium]